MSITGHKDYESMKPYIEIANDTKRYELDKWNGKEWKVRITELLDKFDEAKLKQAYELIRTLNEMAVSLCLSMWLEKDTQLCC